MTRKVQDFKGEEEMDAGVKTIDFEDGFADTGHYDTFFVGMPNFADSTVAIKTMRASPALTSGARPCPRA